MAHALIVDSFQSKNIWLLTAFIVEIYIGVEIRRSVSNSTFYLHL